MSYEAFRSALRLTAHLNEYTLLLNAWIVSPPAASEYRSKKILLGPTLRSISYAISEPFYTLLLARLPLESSFILLMVTVFHGFGVFTFWMTRNLAADLRLHSAPKREQSFQGAKAEHGLATKHELMTDDCHYAGMKDLDWKFLYMFTFVHSQSAATSNAALLLAAQNLEVTGCTSHTVHMIVLSAGLFYFFLSGLADCYFARAMGLTSYLGQYRTSNVVIPQVANLLLVVVLRSGVRWRFGMDIFAGAWGNDARGAHKFIGFAAFLQWLKHAPRWLSLLLLVLSWGLMYLGGRFTSRARME